jgi:hypothetical protein
MYPLPEKVSYKHKEYFHAEFLLVPEYNSFSKPKWPKIITVEQQTEIFESLREKKLPVIYHQGPIPIKNTDLIVNDWWYLSIQYHEWQSNIAPPNEIDPFDNRNQFYIVDRNLK